jgi:hypothetical protein
VRQVRQTEQTEQHHRSDAMIEYKGYTGIIEYDPDIKAFAGQMIDLWDQSYFEGESGRRVSVAPDLLGHCCLPLEGAEKASSRLRSGNRSTPALRTNVQGSAAEGGCAV